MRKHGGKTREQKKKKEEKTQNHVKTHIPKGTPSIKKRKEVPLLAGV
jgi:hypothetical protein